MCKKFLGENTWEGNEPFDCGVGLTPLEERGKEGRLSRENVNCSTVLRKFCQGQWGVLKPKCLSAKSCVSQDLASLPCCHWLGAAPRDRGLGTTWR